MSRAGTILLLCAALTSCPSILRGQDALPDSVDPSGIALDEEDLEEITAAESSPVDINKAKVAELAAIPGFSFSDARLVVKRRTSSGPFHSLRDAAETEGLSPVAADALLKYCVCDTGKNWSIGARATSAWHSDRLGHASAVNRAPDTLLSFDAAWLREWSAGLTLILGPGAASVRAGDFGGAAGLVGKGPAMVPDPAGFHLSWSRGPLTLVAGTFQAGFATGLTMDNTGLERPRGIHPFNSSSISRDTGSIRKSRRFSGVAAAFELPVAAGRFNVSGAVFASYSFMDPPGTDLTWNRCPAGDPDCGESDRAPFLVWDDPGSPDQPARSMTLTNILREGTVGADIGFGSPAFRVEAIGWATGLRYRVDVPSIEAAPSSPMPEGRRIFGAAGIAGSATLPGDGQLIAEIAVNDSGAFAAVAQATYSPIPGLDIEPSFRHYPAAWDNPWTGSIADSSEYRGNRARNETGGRLDVTWRSSSFTRNSLRLDAARHGADDTPESSPGVDIEASTAMEIFASRHERMRLGFAYRDRDVTSGGRGLSWEPYHSGTAGNLSGGCRIDWAFSILTTRIPRTRLAAWVRQSLFDAATLPDRFDIDMAATLGLDVTLAPGPDISIFFRWSDESMAADPTPSRPGGCASRTDAEILPGTCRGDSRLDAGLGLLQPIRFKKGSVRLGLQFRYTRHVDDRLSWTNAADAPTGRNDFAASAEIVMELDGGGD